MYKTNLIPRPQKLKLKDGEHSLNATFSYNCDKMFKDISKSMLNLKFDKDALLKFEILYINQIVDEAYELEVNSNGIKIYSSSNSGVYYALQTLKQWISNQSIRYVQISDAPSLKLRGIVEGFYGEPWTHQKRRDQLEFYGKIKLNAYIYAPKDDKYHREKWRDQYPDDELKELDKSLSIAKDNYVEFIYAIAPGLDLKFNDNDYEIMINKLSYLYKIGIRSFAIFFDDITNRDGKKQADFINRVYNYMMSNYNDINYFLTVPTEYDKTTMTTKNKFNKYTQEFSKCLNEDIIVLWTGNYVVPEELTKNQYDEMNDVYSNLGVWWNYPVTDYNQKKLALGPIIHVDTELNNLDVFLANPMEHANMSKISLGTVGDYCWNQNHYLPLDSWKRSIKFFDDEFSEELMFLSTHSSQMRAIWTIGLEDGISIKPHIDYFWELVNSMDLNKLQYQSEYLTKEFNLIEESMMTLLSEWDKENLIESEKNILKLKQLASLAADCVDMIMALLENKNAIYRKAYKDNVEKYKTLSNDAIISENCLEQFIEKALSFTSLPFNQIEMSDSVISQGDIITFNHPKLRGFESIEWEITGPQTLRKTSKSFSEYFYEEGAYGITQTIESRYGQKKLVCDQAFIVSNTVKSNIQNLVADSKIYSEHFADVKEKANNVKIVDEDNKWCAVKEKEYVLDIEFNKLSMIQKIILYHAEYGNEPAGMNTRNFYFEYCGEDNIYKNLLSVYDNTKKKTVHVIDPITMKKLRLIVTRGTQGVDNSVRLYGIEAFGIEKA